MPDDSFVRHTGFNSFVWQQQPLFTINKKFLDFGLDFLLGITPQLRVSQQPIIIGFLWLTSFLINCPFTWFHVYILAVQ